MCSVSEVEIKSLLKAMVCTPFESHFTMPEVYQKYYGENIRIDLQLCTQAMKIDLLEYDERVYRKRLNVIRAYNFLKYFDNLDEEAILREVDYRFIKKFPSHDSNDVNEHMGVIYKKEALYEYQAIFKAYIKFIKNIKHLNTPFLIGSTDELICKDGRVEALIEVKSPIKASRMSIEDYIKCYNPYSIRYDRRDRKYYINEKSNVYYQVQLCRAIEY